MRIARLLVVGLIVVVAAAAGARVAPGAGRVALVVGNGAYPALARLTNPVNDAGDVSSALRRLGFDVTTVLDARRDQLVEALRVFSRESTGADVALVFYAGHGMEMDGVNYLLPVDARLERDTDVRFETVALNDMLASTSGASLRVVILDACRNNPLAGSMRRTNPERSISRGSLGELDDNLLGDETLVAYATTAGRTAPDGAGRNSPYTAALLAHLEQPLEIGILFREVRARVLEATGGAQRPHEYASLLGEHYLSGEPVVAGDQETVFWRSIVNSTAPADFDAYLEQYPNGIYRALAANRLEALSAAAVEADAPDGADADVGVADVTQLRRRARQGDARAQTELADRHASGRGALRDNGEALRWYTAAAEQGDAHGQYGLGLMYLNGVDVQKDYGAAAGWLEQAAEQGHRGARYYLDHIDGAVRGHVSMAGTIAYAESLVAQVAELAVDRLLGRAGQGDALAAAELGRRYRAGVFGVRRDYGEAAKWYRAAADQGHAVSQYVLGLQYAIGQGVEQDYAKAAEWMRRAAEQGDAGAEAYLRTMGGR